MKHTLLFATVIITAAVSGFLLRQYLAAPGPDAAPAPVNGVAAARVGDPRPEFAMRDLQGALRNIRDWDGKVVLLNFWATWCPPCIEEIPLFQQVRAQVPGENFEVIGIAVDQEPMVREFVDRMSIEYPVMVGDIGAIELSRRYGNNAGGLPFTAFIDRNGNITHMITGALEKERLLAILKELGIDT